MLSLIAIYRLCHKTAPMPIQNIVFFCRIWPIHLSLQLQQALAFPVKLNVLPIYIFPNCLNHQEGTQNGNVIAMASETAHWHGLSFPIHDVLRTIWNNFEYIQLWARCILRWTTNPMPNAIKMSRWIGMGAVLWHSLYITIYSKLYSSCTNWLKKHYHFAI